MEIGNVIVEKTSWPPRCKCLVILKNQFARKYKVMKSFIVSRVAHIFGALNSEQVLVRNLWRAGSC